jgi:hypothetical protein
MSIGATSGLLATWELLAAHRDTRSPSASSEKLADLDMRVITPSSSSSEKLAELDMRVMVSNPAIGRYTNQLL